MPYHIHTKNTCSLFYFHHRYPFHEHSNCIEMAQTILDADVPKLPSGQFSPELIDFISQCLHREPDRRLPAEVLLGAPWLLRYGVTSPEIAVNNVYRWVMDLRESAAFFWAVGV